MFAEVGEVLAGKKTLPKVPDCGKKFIVFKSLGRQFCLYHERIKRKTAGISSMEHLAYAALNRLVSAPLPVGLVAQW